MKQWVPWLLNFMTIFQVVGQNSEINFGKWWDSQRTYKKLPIKKGIAYSIIDSTSINNNPGHSGFYNFWYNGAILPTIQDSLGNTILYIPTNDAFLSKIGFGRIKNNLSSNSLVYLEAVNKNDFLLQQCQAQTNKDSIVVVSEFEVEKYIQLKEYYSKKTIGSEQLLMDSRISNFESWGSKPTNYEVLNLKTSSDSILKSVDITIKNLSYLNDIGLYIENQKIKEFKEVAPFETIVVPVEIERAIERELSIEIKSNKGIDHKFSIAGIMNKYKVKGLPDDGLFKVDQYHQNIFIPVPLENYSKWIIDWENKIYFRPHNGKKGYGFYLPSRKKAPLLSILSDTQKKISLDTLECITFKNEETAFAKNLIIVAEEIYNNPMAKQKIEEYVSFRNNSGVGNQDYKWVRYEYIYNRYGFGAKKSYQGLINYFQKLRAEGQFPDMVWLIGKGYGQNLFNDSNNLIPSYGFPASDFLLVNNLDSLTTGVARLSVDNGIELIQYLQKVMDYETIMVKGKRGFNWKKEVLHISGGKTQEELKSNISILDNAWNEDLVYEFGVNLTSLNKPSLASNPNNLYGEVIEQINNGIGIKVFLGHGGVTSTEIGLDNPEIFTNKGKYPVFIDLGCQTGDVFTKNNSLSEKFTSSSSHGAISYIGSAGYGHSISFSTFLSKFYSELAQQDLGNRLGNIFTRAIKPLRQSNFYGSQILSQQLNYQGDPFIKIFETHHPDYIISDLGTEVKQPNEQIWLKGAVQNIGKIQKDSIVLEISLSDSILVRDTILLTGVRGSFKVALPLGRLWKNEDIQLKITCIQLKSENSKPEINTVNNIYKDENSKEVYLIPKRLISDSKYPLNHAILKKDDFKEIIFKAYHRGSYIIELDTNPEFIHPKRFVKRIKQTPSLISTDIEKHLINNQRYYWRINRGNRLTFYNSNERKGTFLVNQLNQLKPLKVNSTTSDFSILVQAVVRSEENRLRSRFFRDGLRLVNAGSSPYFYVVVLDNYNGQVIHKRNFGAHYQEGGIEDLVDFLEGEVERHQIVSLFTFHQEGEDFNNKSFGDTTNGYAALNEVLEMEGAKEFSRFLKIKAIPYLIVYQKEMGVLKEKLGTEQGEKIEALIQIKNETIDSGLFSTGYIGPSKSWDSLAFPHNLSEVTLLAQDLEGKNQERLRVLNSSRIKKDLKFKNYLALQVKYPISQLDIELFGKSMDYSFYALNLSRDTFTMGHSIEISATTFLSGAISDTSILCFELKGVGIEKDTCIDLKLIGNSPFQQFDFDLWDNLDDGNYQLYSNLNGHLDSLNLVIQPFYRLPQLELMVNGESGIKNQSLQSGQLIRWEVESYYNHPWFKKKPNQAFKIRIIDSEGRVQKLSAEGAANYINEIDGLKITAKGNFVLEKEGVYTIEVIAYDWNGHPIEETKSKLVLDVSKTSGLKDLIFYPNPFKEVLNLSFNYWGIKRPKSLKVRIYNQLGILVKEADLMDTGKFLVGKNLIANFWDGISVSNKIQQGVYWYEVLMNGEKKFSGLLFKSR